MGALMSQARLAILGIAIALVLAGAARAGNNTDQAREHFKKGTVYYQAKQYEQAIAEYDLAYKLVPLPELQYNIAQAERLRGNREEAVRRYRAYLTEVPSGRIAIEARVYLSDLTKQLDAEAAVRQAEADRVAREKAAAEAARVAEEQAAAQAAQAERERQAQAAIDARRRHTHRMERVSGAVLIAVGVVGLVVGGVLTAEAQSANQAFLHPSSGVYSPSAYNDRSTFETGAIIGFSVGGVALVGGMVDYGMGWREGHTWSLRDESDPSREVRP
jgi:tetratricopeptide (TPR) repeat protein